MGWIGVTAAHNEQSLWVDLSFLKKLDLTHVRKTRRGKWALMTVPPRDALCFCLLLAIAKWLPPARSRRSTRQHSLRTSLCLSFHLYSGISNETLLLAPFKTAESSQSQPPACVQWDKYGLDMVKPRCDIALDAQAYVRAVLPISTARLSLAPHTTWTATSCEL